MTPHQDPAIPALPEGWPAKFRCDSCEGNGEVGELVYQGHFQPPERHRCPDCDGRGYSEEGPAFSASDMNTRYLEGYAAGRAAGVQGEARWISVEDIRKPAGRTPILVAVEWRKHHEDEDGETVETEGFDVTEGEYNPKADFFESYAGPVGSSSGVTHWMPLPAAPGTAPQAETLAVAEGLRETLRNLLAMLPSDHEDRPSTERIPVSYCYVRWIDIREARAALAAPKAEGEAVSNAMKEAEDRFYDPRRFYEQGAPVAQAAAGVWQPQIRELIAKLRGGDWSLRSPDELTCMIADMLERAIPRIEATAAATSEGAK